ncbi:hypothetical protein QQ045_024098 [Rhodiola kirilowii]
MSRPVGFSDVCSDDDDFQSLNPISYLTQTAVRNKSLRKNGNRSSQPLSVKHCNRAPKRRKRVQSTFSGKENGFTNDGRSLDSKIAAKDVDLGEDCPRPCGEIRLDLDENCSLSIVESSLDFPYSVYDRGDAFCSQIEKSEISSGMNSIEATPLTSRAFETCSLSYVESTLDPDSSICEEEVLCQKQALKFKESHGFKTMESSALSLDAVENCSLGFVDSSLGYDGTVCEGKVELEKEPLKCKQSYLCNSIESRLLNARKDCLIGISSENFGERDFEEFEPGTQLNDLLKLCSDEDQLHSNDLAASEFNQTIGEDVNVDNLVCCPLCGCDLSEVNEEIRLVHTNECLDKMEMGNADSQPDIDTGDDKGAEVVGCSLGDNHQLKVDVSPVLNLLHNLGLDKYAEIFTQEEIDWDTLQWLTEEDLFSIGVTALGPRKKILQALNELRRGTLHSGEMHTNVNPSSGSGKQRVNNIQANVQGSIESSDDSSELNSNKLITDFFPAPKVHRSLNITSSGGQPVQERNSSKQVAHLVNTPGSKKKRDGAKPSKNNVKIKDVPLWCIIPGTPFRVDAFRYLRRDCSHWFLTHFHIDHYQGLTKSFCHGKIYCSLITAKLINLKIGIPLEKIEILPLNQNITIAGIEVTCLDANHCPGSIIIVFKPPNGKAVLHTGDFRFNEGMFNLAAVLSSPIHTLILDTTYCDPQFDFPKQEAVIQFVIEAIQAEDFNPKTIFLIGSYTIGKERLFLEVARALRKKVYVNAAKLRILQCLGLKDEDLRWFTTNEYESQIHVVPMWTLASTKRLKQISNQYMRRFNLIVAFSPTGWTFGKGKNKSPGKRRKQGTLIRYEVPYSEHSSFTELKEFVKLLSPTNIIPSVNNDGPESAAQMLSLLSS